MGSRGSVHSVFSARGMTPRGSSTSRRPEPGAGAELAAPTHDRTSSVSFPHQHPVTSIHPRRSIAPIFQSVPTGAGLPDTLVRQPTSGFTGLGALVVGPLAAFRSTAPRSEGWGRPRARQHEQTARWTAGRVSPPGTRPGLAAALRCRARTPTRRSSGAAPPRRWCGWPGRPARSARPGPRSRRRALADAPVRAYVDDHTGAVGAAGEVVRGVPHWAPRFGVGPVQPVARQNCCAGPWPGVSVRLRRFAGIR